MKPTATTASTKHEPRGKTKTMISHRLRRTGRGRRALAWTVLVALVLPVLAGLFGSAAQADDDDRDYSLYQLASNASTYFSEKSSPESDGLHKNWDDVISDPASAGSLLGYPDPKFSVSNATGWLFAEVSGAAKTVNYSSLEPDNSGLKSQGLVDYAYFGAANADLGLDAMVSESRSLPRLIGGGLLWLSYGMAVAVSGIFGWALELLALLNPFRWFAGALGLDTKYGQAVAGGQDAPGALSSLASFIADWYGTLTSIAWGVMVPLFLGFLIFGLVMFKKMDKGSAVKKFIVRIIFIGVGLPLLGSMYTSALSSLSTASGDSGAPTQVMMSTLVDFEGWMYQDRLKVPDNASIGWHPEEQQAYASSKMAVRNTAAWINYQTHPEAYAKLKPGVIEDHVDEMTAQSAFKSGIEHTGTKTTESAYETTVGMIQRYMLSSSVSASDFESTVKAQISNSSVDDDEVKKWFVEKNTYGDVEDFGEEDGPLPSAHPILSVAGDAGLTSNRETGSRRFTTKGVDEGCGGQQMTSGDPAPCNLAPLAAYNYLNTNFGSSSLDLYSSNKATSGFTRMHHASVSLVGTGTAQFMYWVNAVVLLGCMALIGLWYGFGMVAQSIKRTFGLVAAIPFATLGALAAISKVIIYSIAMIVEVMGTIFLYSFVTVLLAQIPEILMSPGLSIPLTADWAKGPAGAALTIVMTFIAALMTLVITFALLKVRSSVMKAVDEVVTKLVDKFLDTETAPASSKGTMGGALAQGVGSGVGMAAGGRLMKNPAGSGEPGSGGGSKATNTGGTNGPSGSDGGDGADGTDGDGSGGQGSSASQPDGKGAITQSGTSEEGSNDADRTTAERVAGQGGLSDLGVAGADGRTVGGVGRFDGPSGSDGAHDGTGGHTAPAGPRGSSGQTAAAGETGGKTVNKPTPHGSRVQRTGQTPTSGSTGDQRRGATGTTGQSASSPAATATGPSAAPSSQSAVSRQPLQRPTQAAPRPLAPNAPTGSEQRRQQAPQPGRRRKVEGTDMGRHRGSNSRESQE